MTSVVDISPLLTLGAVSVVFDVSFLLLLMLGACVAVPMIGAIVLGVWSRVLNVPPEQYRRRCLAYGVGYVCALAAAAIMMFMVKDAGNVPGWFLASLFGQALAIHGLVVPLVLKTPWGKGIAAQGLTLVLYGAVLVMAMAPAIIHVRRAVGRAEWTADLEQLYRKVTSEQGSDAIELCETLDAIEQTGVAILLLPGHKRSDVVYLGDYIHHNYPSTLTDRFIASMPEINATDPGTSPLIWRNPRATKNNRLAVCSYDGTVAYLTREELDYHLTQTLLALDRLKLETSTTAPADDQR
jgi:hypothetical protein